MQVVESELVIPLNDKSRLRNTLIRECVFLVFFVGLLSYLIVLALQMAARISAGQFPSVQALNQTPYKEMIYAITVLFLGLVPHGLIIPFLIRQLRRNFSPQLRINYEGIFFSSLSSPSLQIRWEEINQLSSFSFLGSPFFGIVPWNVESVVARTKVSSRGWFRFAVDLNQWIVCHSKSLAPFAVAQDRLPISVDELIAAIQEQFAAELCEHHVTVLGWKPSQGEY